MYDEQIEHLTKRLETYTSGRKRRTASNPNVFASFIVSAREKDMPWKDISAWIAEETGCELVPATLRMWWYRRKKAQQGG